MKRIISGILCFLLVAVLPLAVFAADSAPAEAFTHRILPNGQKKPVATRAVYEAVGNVTARSLGVTGDIGTIIDIDSDENGSTYILTDAGRILCFDAALRLTREYKILDENGGEADISGARGIYICSESEIYISDTQNGRVLYCQNGVITKEITLPESELIPSDLIFQPTRAVRDGEGNLYVISEGSYYGAVLYDPEGEFSGFYGANTVKGNVLTALSYLWDRVTMNDEKRSKTKKALPYQFTDIAIDRSGFVYTCTGMSDSSTGQIRMLSPGGTNILPGADSYNFGEADLIKRLNAVKKQSFVSIETDGQGCIYALDSTFGLIYLYDTEGNLLAAFGGGMGQGKQTGVFSSACSIALSGSRLMVADSLRGTVTVFEQTEFGKTLIAAQELTLNSDYAGAKPLWEQVLRLDSGNRLAYTGLARAAFYNEDYTAATDYAKAGADSEIYSQALGKIQNEYISKNFIWLFAAAVILAAVLIFFIIYTTKKQVILIPNAKIRTLTRGILHPFASFGDIKYKKMGSLPIALVLTALFFLTSAASVAWSDFRYTKFDAATYNSLLQLAQTAGLIFLWSAANWAISTLQEGKGRLKEVYTVSAYSVLPLILYNIISAPLSHLISSPDSTVISGLYTIAVILTGIMLCVGLMVIHDFSFPRFLFTGLLTVFFMILIIFILFMAAMLLAEFWSFAVNVLLEAIRWQ